MILIASHRQHFWKFNMFITLKLKIENKFRLAADIFIQIPKLIYVEVSYFIRSSAWRL
jgi:hypothetical protein